MTMKPSELRWELRERLRDALADAKAADVRHSTAEVAVYRRFIDDHRERIHQSYREAPRGREIAEQQSHLFDAVLTTMFERAHERARQRFPTHYQAGQTELAMAAVGGYGRQQLSPFSDVDIVFIPAREAHPFIDDVVREVFSLITEVLVPQRHPHISHSYRPVTDIPLIDHQSITALMESRFLAGDAELFHRFMAALVEDVHQADFVLRLRQERRAQYEQKRNGVYLVEPNLKNSPGGMRDFHAAVWMSKAAFRLQTWDVLAEMVQQGRIQPEVKDQVLQALEFILGLRHGLHLEKGQKQDVLFVQYQEPLARLLGYGSDEQELAGEKLLHDYYRHAEALHRFFHQFSNWCDETALPVTPGVFVRHRHVWVEDANTLCAAPERLMKLFALAQTYQLHLAPSTERAVQRAAREVGDRLRREPEVADWFLRILGSEGDVYGTLRAMMRLDVFDRVLPEFSPLMTLVPLDPAHEFTVGEHSLKVVANLQDIRDRPDEDSQHLSELMRGLQRPEHLMLAALLHDIGKASRHGDHAVVGAQMTREICRRLGVHGESRDRVAFLVHEHLLMSRTSRLRSLALPETIEQFVDNVPDIESLDMLYLLTYADTDAVGANVLRDVEKRLLRELYDLARLEFLNREQETVGIPRLHQRERARRWVEQELTLKQLPAEEVRTHLSAMPTNYVLNTPPEEIARHIRYVARLPEEHVVIADRVPRGARFTEMTICLYDRPGVLRDIAGTLALNNVDIYLTQLDNRLSEPRISITTLWVDDHGQPVGGRRLLQMLEDLRRVLLQEISVEDLMQQRGRALEEIAAIENIEVHNHLSRDHTVVQVRAHDQVGLLYLLCRALSELQLDISTAKITTWKGFAEDVFYVTDLNGGKLPDEQCAAIASQLRQRLTGQAGGQETAA